MFDQLYKEAYEKLNIEICSMAGRLLINYNEEHDSYYSGQMHALNEILDIMNKISEDLYNKLSAEVKKETAYYEAAHTNDKSRSGQL